MIVYAIMNGKNEFWGPKVYGRPRAIIPYEWGSIEQARFEFNINTAMEWFDILCTNHKKNKIDKGKGEEYLALVEVELIAFESANTIKEKCFI